MRDLTGPSERKSIRQLLQGIFAAEAYSPSRPLWILSAWISDIPVIDNSARNFSAIDSAWPVGSVVLSQVLATQLRNGGRVNVVMRDVKHNSNFVDRLKDLKEKYPESVRWCLADDFHEKGIVAWDFTLEGSMNFTFNGIEVNDEHLIFRTDQQTVSERRVVLEARWSTMLHAAD